METKELIDYIAKVYEKQNWIRYFENHTTIYFVYEHAGKISFPLTPSQYKLWREKLKAIQEQGKIKINNLTNFKIKEGQIEVMFDSEERKTAIVFNQEMLDKVKSMEIIIK